MSRVCIWTEEDVDAWNQSGRTIRPDCKNHKHTTYARAVELIDKHASYDGPLAEAVTQTDAIRMLRGKTWVTRNQTRRCGASFVGPPGMPTKQYVEK